MLVFVSKIDIWMAEICLAFKQNHANADGCFFGAATGDVIFTYKFTVTRFTCAIVKSFTI